MTTKLGRAAPAAVAMGGAVELDEVEQFVDAGGDRLGRCPQQPGRDADIGRNRHVRKQRAILEHGADAPAQGDRFEAADVLARDADAAAIRLDQPVGEPQQRRLARTGAADDRQELALGDVQRDVVDRSHRACRAGKGLVDAIVADQGRGLHTAFGDLEARALLPLPGEGKGPLDRT